MRILGIDYGDSRTGIAVSDPMGWTAQGLEAVKGGAGAAAKRIAELARQYGAEKIVVGYPLNMDGTAGFRAERTDAFISALKAKIGAENAKNAGNTDIAGNAEVIKWDERLTSAEAARIMRESGARPTARGVREKGSLDILSASILLQSYLDSVRK